MCYYYHTHNTFWLFSNIIIMEKNSYSLIFNFFCYALTHHWELLLWRYKHTDANNAIIIALTQTQENTNEQLKKMFMYNVCTWTLTYWSE